MSAVIQSPAPAELKVRLCTWLLLLLAVFIRAALPRMLTLLSFFILNLTAESVLGFGADETWQALSLSISAAAYGSLGVFVYACLLRGTLRDKVRIVEKFSDICPENVNGSFTSCAL